MKVNYEKSYTEKALQYTLIKNHINIYICIYTTEYWSLIECHRNFILFLYYSSAVWWLTLKKTTTSNLYRIKLLCCEFLPISSCLSSIYIFKQMFTSTSYPDHMVSVCLSVCVMKENFFIWYYYNYFYYYYILVPSATVPPLYTTADELIIIHPSIHVLESDT